MSNAWGRNRFRASYSAINLYGLYDIFLIGLFDCFDCVRVPMCQFTTGFSRMGGKKRGKRKKVYISSLNDLIKCNFLNTNHEWNVVGNWQVHKMYTFWYVVRSELWDNVNTNCMPYTNTKMSIFCHRSVFLKDKTKLTPIQENKIICEWKWTTKSNRSIWL